MQMGMNQGNKEPALVHSKAAFVEWGGVMQSGNISST